MSSDFDEALKHARAAIEFVGSGEYSDYRRRQKNAELTQWPEEDYSDLGERFREVKRLKEKERMSKEEQSVVELAAEIQSDYEKIRADVRNEMNELDDFNHEAAKKRLENVQDDDCENKGQPYNTGTDPNHVCGYQTYDIDAYQTLAVNTMSKDPDDFKTRLAICALGLTGEAGEVADHIKKHLGHGHDLDREKVIKEVGDVMWYAAVMSHVLGVKLSEITSKNIAKLKARYPQGFSVEASKNRKLGDE